MLAALYDWATMNQLRSTGVRGMALAANTKLDEAKARGMDAGLATLYRDEIERLLVAEDIDGLESSIMELDAWAPGNTTRPGSMRANAGKTLAEDLGLKRQPDEPLLPTVPAVVWWVGGALLVSILVVAAAPYVLRPLLMVKELRA